MSREDMRKPDFWAEEEKGLYVYKMGLALVETNLLKYPFNLLLNNRLDELLEEAAKRKKSHIVCEVLMPDGTKRVWMVNPSIQFGYPRPFDKKVFITVLKLVSDEGIPPPPIWRLGSLRRICQTMKIQDSGKNKKLVKESLLRISQTSIYAEVFYLKDKKEYWKEKPDTIGGSFTLWSVYWKGESLPNGEYADSIYLHFHIPFIWSLQAFYVCPIDYDYWLSLPPLAQRIYELTGRKLYALEDSEYISYSYPELCQLLPIMPQKYLSDAKRVLDRAHKVLKETGWFSRVQWIGTNKRTLCEEAPWKILYYPGERAKQEMALARKRIVELQPSLKSGIDAEEIFYDDFIKENLIQEIERITGDKHSRPTYWKIVKGLPEEVIWRFLSELKADYLHGPLKVRKSLAAVFMDKVRRYCEEHEIDIGIKFGEQAS
jgi:hypothetical protein